MKPLLLLSLLYSCTFIRDLPKKEYDSFPFDESQKLGGFPINQNLMVTYKTCTTKKMKRSEAVEPLVAEFNKRFASKLIGFSKATVIPKRIVDSSLFIPDEYCVTLFGHPITSTPMPAEASGEIFIQDPRHHTH